MTEPGFPLTRRRFLGGAVAAGALSVLPPGMAQALAAPSVPGSLADVKHVVVLMQENRSFDHYYGTMSGVRGFGDRTAVTMPNGLDVFHQPSASRSDGHLLPFRINTTQVDGQDDDYLPHAWSDQHQAIDGGRCDQWIAAKGEMTMGYLTEQDIPFHRALADAFTICDHYHCSVQGPTTPNRVYLFSGTIDAAGQHGGPGNNNPADYQPVYSWQTYPEFLEQRGVSWRVYANNEVGDDGNHPWVGDYGDNPLWLFSAFHDPANSALAQKAGITPWQPDSGLGKDPAHVLSAFTADCAAGTLPEVSWIVAPSGYCEHPAGRPLNGAVYIQEVLKALWADQELWSSTVLLINYDENDGMFDHVPPPMPPAGATDEYVGGLPIGLGARVPMTVISPWSKGGWVNSQVFDHTSVIRFIETWKHPDQPFPNISPWRRSVCGDLTSCFDFTAADPAVPTGLPVMPDHAIAPGDPDDPEKGLPAAAPPATGPTAAPAQDPGTRPARPLPYQPLAAASLSADRQLLTTTFANQGAAAVQLAAYRADGQTDGPWGYDVAAGATVSDTWHVQAYGGGEYDIAVHGPNRFRWQFAGDANSPGAGVEVTASYTAAPRLQLVLANASAQPVTITVTANQYRGDGPWTYAVPAGGSTTDSWDLLSFDGWYDLSVTVNTDPTFLRRFTGHAENGLPSRTG
ncbi:phosphocholine-specific phospholipase C [Kitasatospora viridis]|uniref:phospholipase C n=1 Tax=Kitasatospora viridis TaxID=281105 RepID=A0A561T637_9ACTN|nr:phospholipase C, phosphocholine-specific [Kitasatospora viridis]TWF82574.1 phospholipase C [Kitasatospora viridis]